MSSMRQVRIRRGQEGQRVFESDSTDSFESIFLTLTGASDLKSLGLSVTAMDTIVDSKFNFAATWWQIVLRTTGSLDYLNKSVAMLAVVNLQP